MLRYQWTCKCCGRQHDELPLDWTAKAPDHYLSIPEVERPARTQLNKDFCTIDGKAFYIRGAIEIPTCDGGRAQVKGLIRAAVSKVVDIRDPILRTYDKVAERAKLIAAAD